MLLSKEKFLENSCDFFIGTVLTVFLPGSSAVGSARALGA